MGCDRGGVGSDKKREMVYVMDGDVSYVEKKPKFAFNV